MGILQARIQDPGLLHCNHIGINALVYLSDGHVLIQQRKGDSTISKRHLTASIATRLVLPGKENVQIDTNYLLKGNILLNLERRLGIDLSKIDEKNIIIDFLGLGQNIYEGGKPQLYFKVLLKGVTADNYLQYQSGKGQNAGKIDLDKCTHICKADEIEFCKKGDKLVLKTYNPKRKKYKKVVREPERSLLCNFYHIQTNSEE